VRGAWQQRLKALTGAQCSYRKVLNALHVCSLSAQLRGLGGCICLHNNARYYW